jgi:transcriptional antiterminator Rof (Rho-off)
MAEAYIPIDCGLHDRLELLAMRRDPLDVDFVDETGIPHRLGAVRLVTWRSRGGEEIGVFVDGNGQETLIRLDRLRTVSGQGGSVVFELPGDSTDCSTSPAGEDPRSSGKTAA